MKELLGEKTVGFYVAMLGMVLAVVSIIRFLLWAPNHKSMSLVVVVALVVGIALNLLLIVKDNDYVMVLTTGCYSVALMTHLTNSVGSFVDAFQGIKMFGDATQVSTIISIGMGMFASVVLMILASFLKRVK